MSYSFSLNKKSNFIFTPILGIGIKHYLNVSPTSNYGGAYRNNVSNSSLTELNYIHSSGNFRYKKILFGACYTNYYSSIYSGLSLGYQSNLFKLMLTGGSSIQFKKTAYAFFEMTVDFFF